MHKRSYSVFGKIDFFSVLQAPLVSLGGSQAEDWVLEPTELQRVSDEPIVNYRSGQRAVISLPFYCFRQLPHARLTLKAYQRCALS